MYPSEELRPGVEIGRGAAFVDVLTFGLSKKVSQTITDPSSPGYILGYKQGELVTDALLGKVAGIGLARYGAKAFNLIIKHTREFVRSHEFRSYRTGWILKN